MNTIRLVIDIRNYEGAEPVRIFDHDAKIIEKVDALSALIETPRPERWGFSLNGRWVAGRDERMRGIRVFPVDTLLAAKQQVDNWRWNDQAALDA